MQALQEAQGQQRLGLLSSSYQQAQATQDAMRQREMQDLAAIMQLGSIPGQYAGQSLNFANQRTGAAFNAAQMRSGAALGRAGATAGMIGSALQGFNSQEGMKFTNPFARGGMMTGFSSAQDNARRPTYPKL